MSLKGIWFEKAWERWEARKRKIAALGALYSNKFNGNDIANIINAVMTTDAAVLDVAIEHSPVSSFILNMMLTIRLDESYRMEEIVLTVRQCTDHFCRVSGAHIAIQTKLATS
jgi:hypothetical protein